MRKQGTKRGIPGAALMMVVLAVLLVACGSGDNNNGSGSRDGDKKESSKTVSTVFGDIQIPTSPKRIIADDYVGTLIALDAIPVGTPGLHLKNPYYVEALEGIADIGDYGNSSPERMTELDPDLIITATDDPKRFEQMNKIAPTISVPYGDLKNAHEEIAYFGELLGLEDKAEAWLKDYDERIAAAKQRVEAVIPPDATFTILELGDKSVWAYGDNFGRGGQPIYQSLERKPRADIAAELMEKQWMELSMETLPGYVGDYIVLTVGDINEWTIDKLKADPIWGSLAAVKQNRVYIWQEERSWYYDPIAVLSQTEELANWLTK